MKLILSTSNIMGSGPSVIRRSAIEKSNTELVNSLRSHISAHKQGVEEDVPEPDAQPPSFRLWTSQNDSALYIPAEHTSPSGLAEERDQYDITVKLFFLPNIPPSRRAEHIKEALSMVLGELKVTSVDLLIISFPGISFDADDEDSDDEGSEGLATPGAQSAQGAVNSVDELETMAEAWQTAEKLHNEGTIARLGVAEFGTQRLSRLLAKASVKPKVDQINVRDCCVVPKPLILYARQEGLELLTHNDCTDILPKGTLRELLGSSDHGFGILQEPAKEGGLTGDVEPQFVVKYTAVVKNRGVVENKGYFAVAELSEER